jgi:hypothetical protein
MLQLVAFGDCCNDLRNVLNGEFNPLFYVADHNGRLYLSVGWLQSEEGTGWFDQAVLFCPFCGARLQTREEIAGSD